MCMVVDRSLCFYLRDESKLPDQTFITQQVPISESSDEPVITNVQKGPHESGMVRSL